MWENATFRAPKSDTPRSPNAVLATKSDSHDESSAHMKRYFNARSNRCHCPTSTNTAPATKNDRPKCERNLLKTDETSFTMRGRSEHDPPRT